MSAPTTFHIITKSFHWLTALLILAIIPLGVIANGWPYETGEQLATKGLLFSMHKTLGVAVFFVALLRILWALTQAKPGPLHPEKKLETTAAEVVHWVLYISLVLVPLTGWIDHAATSGFAPIWWPFGQGLPLVPESEAVSGVFAGLHWIFGKLMVASLLLHIAGALKHHIVDKDVTLKRMWFGKGDMPAVGEHIRMASAPIIAGLAFLAATGAAFALGLTEKHAGTIEAAALEDVASDWQVQDGTISITIDQFGSQVTGSFADWTSQISFDPAPAEVMGSVETVISIGSLTLGSVTSDALGAEYFDAETFPTATFAGDIEPDGETFVADGTLTLRGVTVPLSLPFTLDLDGDTATMAGQVSVNRMDYEIGLTQNDAATLGFEVVIDIALTATRAAD